MSMEIMIHGGKLAVFRNGERDYSIPRVELTGPDARTQPREPRWCVLRMHDNYRRQLYGRYVPGPTAWGSEIGALKMANDFNKDGISDTVYVAMPYSDAWELRACELERGQQ